MAVITNYATLQTAVADYLARSDLTSFIPNFIQNAESKIYKRFNIRAEETALSVNVTSGVGALPTRFKKLKLAYSPTSPYELLQWVPVEDLYRKYPLRSGGNTPCVISREAGNFIFGPYPSDFTLEGVYYQQFQPLRDADSNWYVVNCPDLLLNASCLEAARFIRDDDMIGRFSGLYDESVESLMEYEESSAHPSGSLITRIA